MEAPVCFLMDAMFRVPAKLDALLVSHGHRLPRGAADEIPLIKQDLEKMVAILQEHNESGPDDHAMLVKCLTKEVRELSYDVEDSVDQYEQATDSSREMLLPRRKKYKIGRRRSKATTMRLREKLKWRLWMANKIREFSVRSQEALQRHNLVNLGGIGSSTTAGSTRCSTSFGSRHPTLHRERGIEEHVNKLEEWLGKDGEQKLKVVSVVGSGGIGKTTLAKELYRRIRGQFECRAFVQTSQKPDVRKLLISLLSQVRPHEPPHTWQVHNLIANIRTHLQDKRYLIIIDDVWATQTWGIVSSALPDSNKPHSGILITTRIKDVAMKCCGYQSKYVLVMKPLGEDDSSKLFYNTVFGPQHECPLELSEVSNNIIRKCAGLPLAMVIVASLVNRMGKPEHWDYVNKSLGFGLRTDPTTLTGMKQVLDLSYNHLPEHLKACMMYLSIYQEDYIIQKDDLVQQWIAEGLVRATGEKDKEEISRSYFDELINSRMIQPVHINANDDVLSCTVHSMVLDFVTLKSIEENFVTAIDDCQTTTRFSDKVRRLSLHFGNAEAATPTNMRLSQLRTLAFFGVFRCLPSVVEFGLLRVLILHLSGDDESIIFDLTRISELFRLKYLHIICNATLEVQQTQIHGFHYLETLKIDARMCVVPSEIVHLPALLHLSLPVETNLPNGIGHMTSLCTLGYFDLSVNPMENVQSLGELTNLRDLQLTFSTLHFSYLMRKMDNMGTILAKLSNLRSVTLEPSSILDSGPSSMTISCDGLSSISSPPPLLRRFEWLPHICTFSILPKWIGHLDKLCILKIGVAELVWKDVDILSRLPALTVLSLYVRTKPGGMIVFNNTGFSVLKYFKFCCRIPWLKFEVDAMPNLRKLKLGFDAHVMGQHITIPVGIENLSGLKKISAKIGGAGADDPVKNTIEWALSHVFKMHPARPTFNIQCVDLIFGWKDDSNSLLQEEVELLVDYCSFGGKDDNSNWVQAEEHMTLPEQHKIVEKVDLVFSGKDDNSCVQEEEHMILPKQYVEKVDLIFNGNDDNNSWLQEEQHMALLNQREILEEADLIFSGKDDNNRLVQEEEHMTVPKQYDISIVEHAVPQKGLSEDCLNKYSASSDPKNVSNLKVRSVAERLRRAKISERIQKLQELVPGMEKQTKMAGMLDLAIDYIKELQTQAKVCLQHAPSIVEPTVSQKGCNEDGESSSTMFSSSKNVLNPKMRSVAHRLHRLEISKRLQKLQELVPNMEKQTSTTDMLDLAIEYIKELQMQVKVSDNRSEIRMRGDRDMDNQQILKTEEKEVVSSVATVLSDLCGPGEWMPMRKLHTELVEQFGNVWHHTRVRKYLTSQDWSPIEAKGRPWFGLLGLLRKYPEHFVINTKCKGRAISEFVSLVSLLS